MPSRAKNWAFTLNNYTPEDEERIGNLADHADVQYILFGREVGEQNHTPHLQGHVTFNRKLSLASAKRVLGTDRVSMSVCRNVPANIAYCKKDEDFVEAGIPPGGTGRRSDLDEFKEAVKSGMLSLKAIREAHSEVYAKYPRFVLEYTQDNAPDKVLPDHELRDWQQQLAERLDAEPDDRTIEFIVDTSGNNGKTWFAHWYASKNERVQVLQPGKVADMAYALDSDIRVLFIDAPRSKQGEYVQYDFLENTKNGYVFSTKYESRVKTLGQCHVVVMMNEMPDMSKLSEDRFLITEL